MSEDNRVCVVAGVGPGNGLSLVERFADDGYDVVALARDGDRLREMFMDVDAKAMSCDVTDQAQVEQIFSEIRADRGPVDTLLYNAGSGKFATFDGVEAADLEQSWRVNTLGLFQCAKQVIPDMLDNGGGKIGVTGATASTRGKPFTTAFAQAKGAQRLLAQSLAREFGPQGIHVFLYIVDGVIDTPKTREMMSDKPDDFFLDPDEIAESVWAMAHQPKSAWTFELDLRPFGEDW
jgi:NAD(P)-dependent dehydrogenase (short-subunit alcohol dehydrogenase family)